MKVHGPPATFSDIRSQDCVLTKKKDYINILGMIRLFNNGEKMHMLAE